MTGHAQMVFPEGRPAGFSPERADMGGKLGRAALPTVSRFGNSGGNLGSLRLPGTIRGN
jgi:hypothetical protein